MSKIPRKRGFACAAVGCNIRPGTNLLSDVKLHRFPADPDRRKKWEIALKRENWVATTDTRICNKHFTSGGPSKDPLHPDYIPTVFNHKKTDKTSQRQKLDRYQRQNERRNILVSSQSMSTFAEETSSKALDNIMIEKKEVGTMTDLCSQDISNMESRSQDISNMESRSQDISNMESLLDGYRAQVNFLQESAKNSTVPAVITNNIKAFDFYTKLPSLALFYGLLKLIMSNWKPKTKTSLDFSDQLLLVLMKLRLGLINQDIAYRFSIQRTTAGCIFREWIQRMALVLNRCISKPTSEALRQNIPECFRKANLRNVTSIIDCSEIFINRAFNLDARAQTYSHYKHHNTVKFLLSITPSGYIEFLSKLYGGRVSDTELTCLSGFVDTLRENDVVLADRGFNIKEIVSSKNAHVILPASTKYKKQLSPYEVIKSRQISRVRVHVERSIGRIKSYWIMKTVWPISYFKPCNEETCLGDNILSVIAALCNVSKNELVKM